MKGIYFTDEMITAYQQGATMFIVPIDKKHSIKIEDCESIEDFISKYAPLQKGDDFFIQEEFWAFGYWTDSGSEYPEEPWFEFSKHSIKEPENIKEEKKGYLTTSRWEKLEASEMQEHQARFKDVVLDVEVIKLQDISHDISLKIHNVNIRPKYHLKYWLKKQGITYEQNPYGFVYIAKGTQK